MKKSILSIFYLLLGLYVFGQSVSHDTIVDTRTGIKYPTVNINGTCWMAKNMNIGVMVQNTGQTDNGVIEKTCYNNDTCNCNTYGALYTFREAMKYNESDLQGICPDCWHVATKEDWMELYKLSVHGNVMQQLKTNKAFSPAWDGNNSSGFNAIPAGLAYDSIFGRKGDWAIFWSSTLYDKNYSWSFEMDNYYRILSGFTDLKMTNTYLFRNAFSVRCVKNKQKTNVKP